MLEQRPSFLHIHCSFQLVTTMLLNDRDSPVIHISVHKAVTPNFPKHVWKSGKTWIGNLFFIIRS